MKPFDAYAARSFHFIELLTSPAFRLKLYGIRYSGARVDQTLIDAAAPLLVDKAEQAGAGQTHYGVGFACIHQGKTGNFAFVDWWSDENELHHHVYISSEAEPTRFDYVTPSGLIACVWDLRLIWFEREAWVECALREGGVPDLERYLGMRLNESA